MEILLAKDMGFCWGVRRAIDIMETAAEEHGEIISVGPIVHNPQVVKELSELLGQAKCGTVRCKPLCADDQILSE